MPSDMDCYDDALMELIEKWACDVPIEFWDELDVVLLRMDKTVRNLGVKAALSEIGRRGGLKGGAARRDKLSSQRRSEIARLAARARWHGKEKHATPEK